jgi:glycerate kinase
MKIVIAPDSYKGCLKSSEICEIIEKAYLEVFPDARIVKLPLADGGEGTTEALVASLDGDYVSLEVTGPLGRPVTARYGIADGGRLGIMEMAQAAGIELVERDELNPMLATTRGVGEMILDAVERGVERIVIGIGGSATVDGGAGMATALGYQLLDSFGAPIQAGGEGVANLAEIIPPANEVMEKLANVAIMVACDVDNPISGPNGAAKIYGPQKGATPEMVTVLDSGLLGLMNLCLKNELLDSEKPGDGAAGGLGAGLRAFCGGELLSGANLVCDTVGLDEHLKGASLLITGEGRTDLQTLSGKLCSVVAERAKKREVPSLLISGALGIREELLSIFDYAFSASLGQTSLEELLSEAENNLSFVARNTAATLHRRLDLEP